MDCNSLISMIESKYSKMLGHFGPEEDQSETERLKYIDATSEFLKWMEDTTLRTPCESGDQTISAKQCILNTMNDDPDESQHPLLWESLGLFSNARLKQIFGVEIFSDE